jgi:hypothetical protein
MPEGVGNSIGAVVNALLKTGIDGKYVKTTGAKSRFRRSDRGFATKLVVLLDQDKLPAKQAGPMC